MFDRILVPTDGTPGSERAIRTARDLAATHDATVYAVSVVDQASLGPDSRTDRVERAERALARAREVVDGSDADVEVRTELLEGGVIEQLLQYADQHAVDLVVMGTHGRKGLDRYVVGSVTERVVREADVPVLTVSLGSPDGVRVTSAERAREIAREELETREFSEIELEPGAYDERTSFVVQAVADGQRYNLHVEKESGESHLVPIGEA